MQRFRQTSAPSSIDGCPTLARSLRKRGIPRPPDAEGFASRVLFRMVASAALLLTILLLSACRIDMHVQPRINPLAKSDFFPDQRSARPPVEGTVARGQLHEDSYFYTGKIGSNPGDAMPFAVTTDVLERGRERYNIYCAPCHSRVGDGNGFIPSRGFTRKPPSFHEQRLWHHARLRVANSASRPLEHRGIHPGFTAESERQQVRCSSRPKRAFRTAELSGRTGYRRESAGDCAASKS